MHLSLGGKRVFIIVGGKGVFAIGGKGVSVICGKNSGGQSSGVDGVAAVFFLLLTVDLLHT